MEVVGGFQEQLERALEAKAHFLESKCFSELKEAFRVFQTLFENIYNILLRKSLIQEDPYKYEHKISEIAVPSRESFLDSEKHDKLSQRLSQYHSQLDFLNNYYQFSLNFLNLDRLGRIVALIQYINWLHLSETSTNVTSAALAEALGKIRLGTDTLSSGIINDSLKQIGNMVRKILGLLKEITAYQREAYKLELRRRVIPSLPELQPGGRPPADFDSEELLKKIKKVFRGQVGDTRTGNARSGPARPNREPFYPELVKEVLAEDFAKEAQVLKAGILERLAVPKDRPKKSKKEPRYRTILMEAVRILAVTGNPLNDALRKLNDNKILLDTRRRTVGERFREWMQRLVQRRNEGQFLEIEYFDSGTSTRLVERIDFDSFYEGCLRKIKLYLALSNKMSTTYRRLQSATEDQIFEFLDKSIKDLHLIHRRMEGLGTYFRSEVTKNERGRLKGVKIELAAIKNSIVKSNQRKHNYVALKEEEQQMKKLGISTEEQ